MTKPTTYNTPFCDYAHHADLAAFACTLSKDAPPDWAGRRFNLPLQATAAATGNGHSGRRALGKTPRTPFAFKDSMIHCILQWYRILLRSSSMHKPKDPPLEVVNGSVRPRGLSRHHTNSVVLTKRLWPQGPRPRLLAEQLNQAPQCMQPSRQTFTVAK